MLRPPRILWSSVLLLLASGLPVGAVPGPDAVPVRGHLAFEEAGTARGELSLGGPFYWHAHWQAAEGAPLAFERFGFAGETVAVEYHVRTLASDDLASRLPKQRLPYLSETLRDVSLELALVPGPQEVLAAGWADPAPRVEAWRTSEWSLSTARAGTEVANQPYGRIATDVGYLHSSNVLLEGEARVLRGQVEKVYLYGYNVTIHHRDGADKLYRTGVWNETLATPLGPVGAGTFQREGLLVLAPTNGTVDVLRPSRPSRIYAPAVTFEGDLGFPHTKGRLEVDAHERLLAGEPLRMHGAFAVSGKDVSGQPHAVGLEGRARLEAASAVPVPPSADIARVLTVVVGAGLLGLAALGLWFYTRLQGDELLDQPERARIHQAIGANPGITIDDLARPTGLHRNTIRYHVGLLRRHGRVRAYRTDHAWRHIVANVDLGSARRASLLGVDAKVADLVAFVAPGPCPGAQAARHVQERWGLSRSKAWEVVNRAAAVDLVRKEREGRRVVVSAVPPGASVPDAPAPNPVLGAAPADAQ